MRKLLLLAFSMVLTGFGEAQAQDIPVYDPNYIPLDLRATRVEPCKVMVAADPTWPRSKVNGKNSAGTYERGASFLLGADYWKQDQQEAGKYVLSPFLSMSVKCSATKLTITEKFDGLDSFANHFYDSVKKKNGPRSKRLKKFNAPGLGPVYRVYDSYKGKTESRAGAVSDVVNFFALHRGQLISVRVTVTRKPPSLYVMNKRKGQKITLKRADGSEFVFKLASSAKQHLSGGAIAGARSAKQNDALFKAIGDSLQGY